MKPLDNSKTGTQNPGQGTSLNNNKTGGVPKAGTNTNIPGGSGTGGSTIDSNRQKDQRDKSGF